MLPQGFVLHTGQRASKTSAYGVRSTFAQGALPSPAVLSSNFMCPCEQIFPMTLFTACILSLHMDFTSVISFLSRSLLSISLRAYGNERKLPVSKMGACKTSYYHTNISSRSVNQSISQSVSQSQIMRFQ